MTNNNNSNTDRSAFNMGNKTDDATGGSASTSSANMTGDRSKIDGERDRKSETTGSLDQGKSDKDMNVSGKTPETSGDRR